MPRVIKVRADQLPTIVEPGHLVWAFNDDECNIELMVGPGRRFLVGAESVWYDDDEPEEGERWKGAPITDADAIRALIQRLNPMLPDGRFLRDVSYEVHIPCLN